MATHGVEVRERRRSLFRARVRHNNSLRTPNAQNLRNRGDRVSRVARALLVLVMAAVSLTVVPSVAAAGDDAVVLPPASYTALDCAGKTPIVVASDAAAQSDLYSAVTLAGVVETDCIVLAGARSESWPAEQRARLDAADADGYVVGGLAAVPSAKVAGLSLERLAGADRWATARLVGNEARSLAGAEDGDADASAGAEDPTTDCTGDIPIVAASDAAAQSDLYSAVTLAGVVGTDCIVLAGPRDRPMPAAQRIRLSVAAEGGFIVGGTASVPEAKVAGRDLPRIAGDDRWHTAESVGSQARAVAIGERTANDESVGLDEGFSSVSVGSYFSCGLRNDGTIDCWGSDWRRQVSDVPSGTFSAVDAGRRHACGLRSDGSVECWGYHTNGLNRSYDNSDWSNDAPSGSFKSISAGADYSCGLRSDNSITCWGDDDWRLYHGVRGHRVDPPDGTYVAVSAGSGFACGIRTGGTVVCWGENTALPGGGRLVLPPTGEFSAVSAGWRFACGLRPAGQVECWEYDEPAVGNPTGEFVDVAAAGDGACGLRTNGRVECWPDSNRFDSPWDGTVEVSIPSEATFSAVDYSYGHACALHRGGSVECWGENGQYQAAPHRRDNPSLGFQSVRPDEHGNSCGIRRDGTIACWDRSEWDSHGSPADGETRSVGIQDFHEIRYRNDPMGAGPSRAVWAEHRFDGSVRLLGRESRDFDAFDVVLDDRFTSIDGPCGLRVDGDIVCWNRMGAIAHQWPGSYVSLGGVCGVRVDGSIACPRIAESLLTPSASSKYKVSEDIPSEDFLSVYSVVDDLEVRGCGIRADESIACWGDWTYYDRVANEVTHDRVTKVAMPPSGRFVNVSISASGPRACGIRTNGTLACWGAWGYWNRATWDRVEPPSGIFVDVALAGRGVGACGVKSDTRIVCWGVSDVPFPPPVH